MHVFLGLVLIPAQTRALITVEAAPGAQLQKQISCMLGLGGSDAVHDNDEDDNNDNDNDDGMVTQISHSANEAGAAQKYVLSQITSSKKLLEVSISP